MYGCQKRYEVLHVRLSHDGIAEYVVASLALDRQKIVAVLKLCSTQLFHVRNYDVRGRKQTTIIVKKNPVKCLRKPSRIYDGLPYRSQAWNILYAQSAVGQANSTSPPSVFEGTHLNNAIGGVGVEGYSGLIPVPQTERSRERPICGAYRYHLQRIGKCELAGSWPSCGRLRDLTMEHLRPVFRVNIAAESKANTAVLFE